MKVHVVQAIVVLTAIVATIAEQQDVLAAIIPPKTMVYVLAVTNVVSALLPKLLQAIKAESESGDQEQAGKE